MHTRMLIFWVNSGNNSNWLCNLNIMITTTHTHTHTSQGGLHCQARCDYNPWRHCSLYGSAWQWRWKQSPMSSIGLLQEVTFRPHMISSQIQWACYKRWNGKPTLECVDGQRPPLKTPVGVLPWTCRSEGKWPRRSSGRQRKTTSSGLLLRRSEVLRSLRHYPRAQSQGHYTIDASKREAWKEEALHDLPWKDERGQLSIRQTVELFQRQLWGNFWEAGWTFPSA